MPWCLPALTCCGILSAKARASFQTHQVRTLCRKLRPSARFSSISPWPAVLSSMCPVRETFDDGRDGRSSHELTQAHFRLATLLVGTSTWDSCTRKRAYACFWHILMSGALKMTALTVNWCMRIVHVCIFICIPARACVRLPPARSFSRVHGCM